MAGLLAELLAELIFKPLFLLALLLPLLIGGSPWVPIRVPCSQGEVWVGVRGG